MTSIKNYSYNFDYKNKISNSFAAAILTIAYKSLVNPVNFNDIDLMNHTIT